MRSTMRAWPSTPSRRNVLGILTGFALLLTPSADAVAAVVSSDAAAQDSEPPCDICPGP